MNEVDITTQSEVDPIPEAGINRVTENDPGLDDSTENYSDISAKNGLAENSLDSSTENHLDISAENGLDNSPENNSDISAENEKVELGRLRAELQILANEIREVDVYAAGRLWDLSQDIETRRGKLAHLNFYAILNPSGIEEQAAVVYQKRGVILGLLEWFRNFLVLLPIALTWIGLSHATAKYQELVTQDDTLLDKPFLLLWEQGFPGLESTQNLRFDGFTPDTFSELALVAFWILLAVLVLTFFIHFWQDVIGARAEQRAASLRFRLEQVLWKLSELSATERLNQGTAQAAIRVGEAMERFRVHAQELLNHLASEQALSRRQRELGDFELLVHSLNKSMTELGQQVRGISFVNDSLQGPVNQLVDHQQQLLRSIESLNTSSSMMAETARTMSQNVDDLNRVVTRNTGNARVATNAMSDMRKLASNLVEGENTLREALDETRTDNRKIQASLGTTVSELRQINSTLGQLTEEIKQLGNSRGFVRPFGSSSSSLGFPSSSGSGWPLMTIVGGGFIVLLISLAMIALLSLMGIL